MPYIPHTDEDIKQMLATIGVSSIDELFVEIPEGLKLKEPLNVPDGCQFTPASLENSYGATPPEGVNVMIPFALPLHNGILMLTVVVRGVFVVNVIVLVPLQPMASVKAILYTPGASPGKTALVCEIPPFMENW